MENANLGIRIKQLRLEKDMTLEELGNAVGVGKSTVRKWETGMIKNMRRDKIPLLANTLGCDIEYLLGIDKNLSIDTGAMVADLMADDLLVQMVPKMLALNTDQKIALKNYIDFLQYQEK